MERTTDILLPLLSFLPTARLVLRTRVHFALLVHCWPIASPAPAAITRRRLLAVSIQAVDRDDAGTDCNRRRSVLDDWIDAFPHSLQAW
jgi:hypothetical protein